MSTELENTGSHRHASVPGDATGANGVPAPLGRADQHAHFSARVIFRALGRRWRVALTLGLLLGTGAALALAFARPVTYTAYALLRVPGTDSKILPGPNVEDPDKTFQKTQVALIKSRKTLQAALRDRLAQQVSFL